MPEKKNKHPMTRGRLALLFVAGLVAIASLLAFLHTPDQKEWPFNAVEAAKEVSFSTFQSAIQEEGDGRSIAIIGNDALIQTGDENLPGDRPVTEDGSGERPTGVKVVDDIATNVVKTKIPFEYRDEFFADMLQASGYDVGFYNPESGTSGLLILSFTMQGLFIMLILFMVVKMTGLLPDSFGTEKGFRVIKNEDLETGLADVAGLDNARESVDEIISLIKGSGSAGMAGGRMPRGLILDGPPGTGKTLIAKAVAKEAGVTFIEVDASSLNQMFVGLGSLKIRRIFRRARKMAPCIIFIDEIDAMGRKRGSAATSGSQESDNTLNALLTELDGFSARDKIFVVAATNRADMLDDALTRPGRIDRKITIGLPDISAREEILVAHCKKLLLDEGVDLRAIAATSYGASGADLANLVNEAALNAGRAGRKILTMVNFNRARDHMLLPQSGSRRVLQDDERYLTAVHEAGHALAALLTPGADPVEKITIAPQGGAMGFVLQSPDRDRAFHTKQALQARLIVCVAGREAERMIFGDDQITTGAASDIRQATSVAKAMVMTYGMSELGFIEIKTDDPATYDINNPPSRLIGKMIDDAIVRAAALLADNRADMQTLIDALLEKETLTGAEAAMIFADRAA